MTMYISPDMDEDFHKWWHSPREKLRRGLADWLGIDLTFTVLHNIVNSTLHLGFFHRRPQIIAAVMLDRGRGKPPFIFAGITSSCGKTRLDFMGMRTRLNDVGDCPYCAIDIERSNAANQRIAKSFVTAMTGMNMYRQQDDGGDEGQPVGAIPPRPVKPSGGLTQWP